MRHDNSTTADFGFVQPLMCREIVPQSSLNLRTSSFVRLSPLVKPTFGRVSLHHYDVFVPINEIYKPFDNMLSGTTYRSNVDYLPTQVPSISPVLLKLILCSFATCSVFDTDSQIDTDIQLPEALGKNASDDSKVKQALKDLVRHLNPYKNATANDWFLANFFTTEQDYSKATLSFGYKQANEDTTILPGAADFVFFLPNSTDKNKNWFITFRLTMRGKNFRKVLLGCGYQLNDSTRQLSALPLFAFYKAYFDLFVPQRFISWSNTNAYKLQEIIESNNLNLFTILCNNRSDVGKLEQSRAARNFFIEISEAYYTQNPDYVSAHITGTTTQEIASVNSISPEGELVTVVGGDGNQALIDGGTTAMGRAQLRILNFLSKYLNIHTATGGRIDKFLKSIYGAKHTDNYSNFIGSQITPIEISDVMQTAETEQGYLGEYAGKGVGGSEGRSFNFKTEKFGFLVHLACIVPDSGYSQAVDPNLAHLGKFDFYTPELDALTLLPNPKMFIYGTQDVTSIGRTGTAGTNFEESFGNIPNYSEYKTAFNVLNGDMSLRSSRASYLPFTLDKLLPYGDVTQDVMSKVWKFDVPDMREIVNGTHWRYINRHRWLGNFNRIFVNEGVGGHNLSSDKFNDVLDQQAYNMNDNFIIHNNIQLNVSSMMLPLADSFDTGTDGQDGRDIEVEHS